MTLSAGVRLLLALLLVAASGCATAGRKGEVHQNPASYHYQMGLSYLGERNYTSALVELSEAERLDGENPELLYNLALAYIGKKRYALAAPRLERAVALKPNYSVARNLLGVVCLELKQWDRAIDLFRQVKEDIFSEEGENAAINLGLAYLGKGDLPRAQEELAAAVAANPRNPVARLCLGRVLFAMERTEQAVSEYLRSLDLFPEYGDAFLYLGVARLKLGNQAGARAAFTEVVRIKPDSESGRLALGYLDTLK